MIKGNENTIKSKYYLTKKILGKGNYGCVVKAHLRDNKTIERAVKIIPKKNVLNADRIKLELDILRQMDHPNVVKLYEWFEDAVCYYVVMEYLEGGDILEKVLKDGSLGESKARDMFRLLVRSINYCHKCNIIHRDLKPENFMYISHTSDDIKLIDFGLSKIIKPNKSIMHTKAGSPYYRAPEVNRGKYDYRCDVWSLGVTIYVLLCGYPPFEGNTDEELQHNITHGSYNFEGDYWKAISENAKDLIRNCLQIDPEDRFNMDQVLQHPWLSTYNKADTPTDSKVHNTNTTVDIETKNFNGDKELHNEYHDQSFIVKYLKFNKFKKIVYAILVNNATEIEVKKLKSLFEKIDSNGDGTISRMEMYKGLEQMGIHNDKDYELIFNGCDISNNGTIEYTEFLAAMIDHRSLISNEHYLSVAFNDLDNDGSGYLELDEIMPLFEDEDIAEVKEMFDEMDLNKDGLISYQEFKTALSSEFISNSNSFSKVNSTTPNQPICPNKNI